jgi:hypothetical protein
MTDETISFSFLISFFRSDFRISIFVIRVLAACVDDEYFSRSRFVVAADDIIIQCDGLLSDIKSF